MINRTAGINRAVALVEAHVPMARLLVHQSALSQDRLDSLRRADGIVRRVSAASGFDSKVWQFPVVLIPVAMRRGPIPWCCGRWTRWTG